MTSGKTEFKMICQKYHYVMEWGVAAILGVIAFLVLYGLTPLDVTNDNWLMAGYDEADILQHYAGWLAFRDSEWAFPLGLASKMARGDGTIISYTDSVPLAAIFFKIFRNILPQTFQYFGIYTLVCYILQALAGFLILKFKTKDVCCSLLGDIFICFAPILLERAFRHTALGSQWLVLFAIYIYCKHRYEPSYLSYLYVMMLEMLAVGIHPYFLPMVACFGLLCCIQDISAKKYLSIILYTGTLTATYGFGYVIGVLGHGIGISRWGYGYYSMNLNAIINPTSYGGYAWSAFLKIQPQILGNYDGFNYLGLGVIFGIVLLGTVLLLSEKEIEWGGIWRNNGSLIVVCVLLTLFAVSNVVTYNDRILLEVPLSDLLMTVCGIFRASSRLFYPVYYLMIIALVSGLWSVCNGVSSGKTKILLMFLVGIQLFDIHHCVIQKHQMMAERRDYADEIITDDLLAKVGDHADALLLDSFAGNSRILAIWAFKHHMDTYYTMANSGTYPRSAETASALIEKSRQTGDIGRNVIVTTDQNVAEQYGALGIKVFKRADCYFLFGESALAGGGE